MFEYNQTEQTAFASLIMMLSPIPATYSLQCNQSKTHKIQNKNNDETLFSTIFIHVKWKIMFEYRTTLQFIQKLNELND
jgi:hypothetical protein